MFAVALRPLPEIRRRKAGCTAFLALAFLLGLRAPNRIEPPKAVANHAHLAFSKTAKMSSAS